MEMHGKLNLVDSQVKSDEFTSDQQFNKLVVNNLSEVDQGTLDHDVVIFNKADDKIYTYSASADGWISYDSERNNLYGLEYIDVYNINEVKDVYNIIHLNETHSKISVDPDLFNFGDIGSPIDFVIDFWLKPDQLHSNGTLLYNGLNVQQVDLEVNKNFLVTSTSKILNKDPNYQAEPTYLTEPTTDGYVQTYRPRLISKTKLFKYYLVHVAIIRSGETTYLAINGKIEDSAPSEEYFHYDNVLIGGGYTGYSNAGLINLRISKNTDRGWTTDFTPPNFNHIVDVNTDFLMDSTSNVLVDNTGNYDITVTGDAIVTSQDRFYHEVDPNLSGNVISSELDQDKLVLKFAEVTNDLLYIIKTGNMPIEIITNKHTGRYYQEQETSFTVPINSQHEFNYHDTHLIVEPTLITNFKPASHLSSVSGLISVIYAGQQIVHYETPSGAYRKNSAEDNTFILINRDLNNDAIFPELVDSAYTGSNRDFGYFYPGSNQLGMMEIVHHGLWNQWNAQFGYYKYAWTAYFYSSTYGTRMYYGESNNHWQYWQIENYDAQYLNHPYHLIFAFYNGRCWVYSKHCGLQDTYNVVYFEVDPNWNHFRRYHYGSSTYQFAMERSRLLTGPFTDEQIEARISESFM